MLNKLIVIAVLSCVNAPVIVFPAPTPDIPDSAGDTETSQGLQPECKQVVIAHRGASGYIPEHTLAAYALAVLMGSDYIEPDLVITKDGQLISRHDNELGLTTDIRKHEEFALRYRNKTVDGAEISGWFTEDFTLDEIKTLRAIERLPNIRPGSARMDGTFTIPTFQEVLDLVKGLQFAQNKVIGIYPEIKHSTYFHTLGLHMEPLVVDTFKNNGYDKATDPVYIQSFELSNLQELKKMTNLKLLQLYPRNKALQPFDQKMLRATLTYGDMATKEGLRDVAKYASAVGPDKSYIIPIDSNGKFGNVTSFVADAHAVNLKVHPYTFRAENSFLPVEFRSNGSSADFGDFAGELKAFFATGVDGVFTEQPDITVRVRGPC